MIPLYKPYMPALPEMDSILHSGRLAFGVHTKTFEEKLRQFFSAENVAATNSFNTAISVAISTLDITCGDEIITSPMACLASTQPYASGGLKIVWADVDNHTGTLDPDSVKSRITAKTKAIVHNHFCGYPGYIAEINRIGKENGIPVIDDGIECFGSEYKGKKIGACGTDVTVFSFTAVRIPNTIDGGAVLFADKALYQKSLLVRDCGIDRSIFRDELGEISPSCDIRLVGYSATMSDVNGYIGSAQMDHASALIEKQRRQARWWDEQLQSLDWIRPLSTENGCPNYWVYGALADNKREAICFFRDKGYYASGVHINNNIYSIFGGRESLSGTEDFYRHFVALPCGWWMDDE